MFFKEKRLAAPDEDIKSQALFGKLFQTIYREIVDESDKSKLA